MSVYGLSPVSLPLVAPPFGGASLAEYVAAGGNRGDYVPAWKSYYAAVQSASRCVMGSAASSVASSASGPSPGPRGVTAKVRDKAKAWLSGSSRRCDSIRSLESWKRVSQNVSMSSCLSLAESISHEELDAMKLQTEPGYCYSVLIRPDLREAVSKVLGPSPTLEALVSRPVEDFVSVAALNSIRVVADEQSELLHVTTDRKSMVRFMTVVRSMDFSRAPSGSLWKFASAYSPCTAVFVRNGVWRVGAIPDGEYHVEECDASEFDSEGARMSLAVYTRDDVRFTQALEVSIPPTAEWISVSRSGRSKVSFSGAQQHAQYWLATQGFPIPLRFSVVGGVVVKAMLGDGRP